MSSLHQAIDQLFRREAGKITSVLVKLLGPDHWETAHDIVQDTLLQAMQYWSYKGIPDNPSAWLYKVARNRAIDLVRREKKFREISPLLQSEYSLSPTINQIFLEGEIRDSQLSMIFACAHPAIPEESQVALILKTLCGLSTHEIARSFLTASDTIDKRIYRAREKIRSEKISLEVPTGEELSSRMEAVLKSIYLLFSEGYNSSHPNQLIRKDLCSEAIRLATFLTQQKITRFPRTYALLALMHFQASRLDARLDQQGEIILLKDQDRRLWNRDLIRKGFELLEQAAEPFETSVYHFEAAIASIHASSPSFEQTDWKSIYHLYEMLYAFQPGPIIGLNKAIASSYAIGARHAIDEMNSLKGLENHYLYYASLGEFHFALKQFSSARAYFEKAMEHTPSNSEKALLKKKIGLCKD